MSVFIKIEHEYISIEIERRIGEGEGRDEIVIEIYLVLTGQFLNTRNKLIS